MKTVSILYAGKKIDLKSQSQRKSQFKNRLIPKRLHIPASNTKAPHKQSNPITQRHWKFD